MAVINMDAIDEKIKEQQERLNERPEVVQPQQVDMSGRPWTMKMKEAFEAEVNKSVVCKACNYQNFGQPLFILNFMAVMREQLPLPTQVCKQCGSLFIPKWARKVLNQAIAEEKKILKRESEE